jgi:hypothetical protein
MDGRKRDLQHLEKSRLLTGTQFRTWQAIPFFRYRLPDDAGLPHRPSSTACGCSLW